MKYKDEILRLRSEGKTYNEIVSELGCSKGTVSYHLGEGQKQKTNASRIKNKKIIDEYIREYKESMPCMDCGKFYRYWVMDLDHIRDKSFGLGKYSNYTRSLDRIKEEIDKCELVCSNCHRERTQSRL